MTKRYFTRHFIETPNSIAPRQEIEKGKSFGWKFDFRGAEISLHDEKRGLWADCYIHAKTLDDAEEKSSALIENILTLVDFSTGSCSSSFFVSSYDASPSLPRREYKQVFHVPMRERNVTVIDKKVFGELFDKPKDERIVRSMSWLRKGYLEQNHIDRFIAFWTGLESINELLCDFFEVPTEDREFKCNKCANTIERLSSIGIKKLFLKEAKIDNTLFSQIRKARGKLLHGGGPLSNDFVNRIRKHNPLVRKALIIGIGKLLQIDAEIIEGIIQRKSVLYSEEIKFIIKTNLVDFNPPGIGESGKQPRLDIAENKLLGRIVDTQGTLDITKKMAIRTNVKLHGITLDVMGHDNTSVTSFKIKDIRIVNQSV